MTDKPNVLICNPDEAGWIHGKSVSQIATAPWCQHPVKVSAAGVGLMLTTPGLLSCCWRCIPGDADPNGFQVLPEVRQQFEEETGELLTDEIAEKLKRAALRVAARNKPQGRKP